MLNKILTYHKTSKDYNKIMDYCLKNNKNPRFNINQFNKYLPFVDEENNYFYGCYENEQLVALSILKKCREYSDCVYICSIQSLMCGNNYGKNLLFNILNTNKFVYFLCNPDDSDKGLYDYYKKNFSILNELKIENSIYDGKTIYFFYKIFDKRRREILIQNLKKDYTR